MHAKNLNNVAPKPTTRNISVTPELDDFVGSCLNSGLYGNYSEVVRAALRMMKEAAEERNARLKKIIAGASQSIEQAQSGEVMKLQDFKEASGA